MGEENTQTRVREKVSEGCLVTQTHTHREGGHVHIHSCKQPVGAICQEGSVGKYMAHDMDCD